MRERPILFSAPMVRAILAGNKTQTRRVISPVQPRDDGLWPAGRDPLPDCKYGQPGDRLWVRETWGYAVGWGNGTGPIYNGVRYRPIAYRVDNEDQRVPGEKWRPSIYMPRWASRITLEITGVRVQRLQEISEDDARAEGVIDATPIAGMSARDWFADLWIDINSKRRGCSWTDNPWVWALTFRRIAVA